MCGAEPLRTRPFFFGAFFFGLLPQRKKRLSEQGAKGNSGEPIPFSRFSFEPRRHKMKTKLDLLPQTKFANFCQGKNIGSKRKCRVRRGSAPHTPVRFLKKAEQKLYYKVSGSANKPSLAGKGDRLRWMRRSPNNRQTVSRTTLLIKSFCHPVAKSTTICQRHISYCEAVYHSSLLISFSRPLFEKSGAKTLKQSERFG